MTITSYFVIPVRFLKKGKSVNLIRLVQLSLLIHIMFCHRKTIMTLLMRLNISGFWGICLLDGVEMGWLAGKRRVMGELPGRIERVEPFKRVSRGYN